MNFTSTAAYSLTKSLKKDIHQMPNKDEASPGPIYNVSRMADQQQNVSHSIGKSQRYNINHWIEKTPSPVHYNQQQTEKDKGRTIPQAENNQQPNQNPDPGCYQPDYNIIKPQSIKFSMGSRYPSIMDDVKPLPGPGHYQSQKSLPILQKSKSVKETFFGTATRFKVLNNQAGVGEYQVISKQSLLDRKMSIGKAQRSVNKHQQPTPGPTDYSKKSIFQQHKLAKTIAGRQKNCFENLDVATHAFLSYTNPQIHIINSKKYSIGKAKREVFVGRDSPGPTDYINDNVLKRNSSHAVIPNAIRDWQYGQQKVPGPGSYNIEDGNKKGYTIGRSKSQVQIISENPGVGRYMINNSSEPKTKVKAHAFPKSSRTNFISKNTAGVGDYNITQILKTKGTISKAERFKKQTLPKPGPGDYHIHSIIGYKSPNV